jgi:hypothetical protein
MNRMKYTPVPLAGRCSWLTGLLERRREHDKNTPRGLKPTMGRPPDHGARTAGNPRVAKIP